MRQKLARYEENRQAHNVIEPGKVLFDTIKGHWAELFGNNNPLVVELACGNGEYTTGLAEVYPDKNFVGVDIKGNRIWKGSRLAFEKQLHNVAFLRVMIQNLDRHFAPGEVSEIWITFPDPRPKNRDRRRRLTHLRFLRLYHSFLKAGGLVHLKTDSADLAEFSMEQVKQLQPALLEHTDNLYGSAFAHDHKDIKTKYEKRYLAQGIAINYLRFSMPAAFPDLEEAKGQLPDIIMEDAESVE